MKRIFLVIVIVGLVASLVYRLFQQRQTADIETIQQIQYKEGYPVEVIQTKIEPFRLIRRYTGSVVGGAEASVMAVIGEYIDTINVSEGMRVSAGDIIIRLSRDNPSARYQAVVLALQNVNREVERLQALFDQGAISRQMLDNVILQRDLSRDALETAENLLDVRAPIDGIVTELNAEVGQYATPGRPLARIISTGRPRVKINVPAGDREWIKRGLKCEVSATGVRSEGHIQRIALSADMEGRNFIAWIVLDERTDNPLFSPGLLVDVSVRVVNLAEAVTISTDALLRSGDNWNVYVISEGHANLRKVDFGGRNAQSAWIRSGLDAGVSVVISGANLLYEGALVRVISRDDG